MASARDKVYPKTKRYVIVKDASKPKDFKGSWKKGSEIRIYPGDLRNYIAAGIIVPFDTAINEKLYDPTLGKPIPVKKPDPKEEKQPEPVKKEPTKKVVETKPTPKATKPQPKSETKPEPKKTEVKKPLIGNDLRAAVQAKKAEDEKAKINADKLAAIKAGGSK